MTQLDELLAYEYSLPGRGVFYRAVAPQAADPDHSGFADCAGLQCAAMHHVGIATPAFYMNSGQLWAWCVREGTATRDPAIINLAGTKAGYLLFVGILGDEHVAISTGADPRGGQFAAHSPSLGLGFASFDAHHWYGVARIPGLNGYDATAPAPSPQPTEGDLVLDPATQDQIKLIVQASILDMVNGPGTVQQSFRDGLRRITDNAITETLGTDFVQKARTGK